MVIAYRLGGTDSQRASRFVVQIFGQEGVSRGHRFRRHGLLDGVPHWRVIRGVVVVRPTDRAKVVNALKRWTNEVYWWPIRLREAERLRLS